MSGLAIEHACPGGDASAASLFERASGCLAATIFSITYIAVPLCILSIPLLLFCYPSWWATWAVVVPFVLSAITPPVPSRSFLLTWPFKYMPKYFNYSEIKEISDEGIQKLIGSRGVIFAVQPHGVFSFGGASAGVSWAKRWWHPKSIPTAVAASVSALPFIKHIVGLFGLCDASNKPMAKRLAQRKSCVLYIGGIAELFLTSPHEECIFARKRKGFIKLALRSGAEICPVYFFGNTSVLSVVSNKALRRIARATGVTLTWFWGWRGTLIPRPNKIVGVLGKPLGMPAEPVEEPTQQQIDQWHDKYLVEVRRIYETYQKYNPDYKDKQLVFE